MIIKTSLLEETSLGPPSAQLGIGQQACKSYSFAHTIPHLTDNTNIEDVSSPTLPSSLRLLFTMHHHAKCWQLCIT